MRTSTPADDALPHGDSADVTIPPATSRHPPGHGLMDNVEVAAMDEVQHEAALRDSALRAPR
jgi:predicted nucleotidyltransferase